MIVVSVIPDSRTGRRPALFLFLRIFRFGVNPKFGLHEISNSRTKHPDFKQKNAGGRAMPWRPPAIQILRFPVSGAGAAENQRRRRLIGS
jgi:hypothetical protein